MVAMDSDPSMSHNSKSYKHAMHVWRHQMQQQAATGRISNQTTSHTNLPTFEPTVFNVVGEYFFKFIFSSFFFQFINSIFLLLQVTP